MKTMRRLAGVLAMGMLFVSTGRAQEKPKVPPEQKEVIQLKVQVVFSEFERRRLAASLMLSR